MGNLLGDDFGGQAATSGGGGFGGGGFGDLNDLGNIQFSDANTGAEEIP